jgi:hypothetical protein
MFAVILFKTHHQYDAETTQFNQPNSCKTNLFSEFQIATDLKPVKWQKINTQKWRNSCKQ